MNCPQCDQYCPIGTEKCDCGYVFPSHAEPGTESSPQIIEPTSRSFRKISSKESIFKKFDFKRRAFFKILFIISIITLGASYFFKDRLPGKEEVSSQIYPDPVQKKENIPSPFEVTQKGITYTVTPLFNYELSGLVVSYHHSEGFLDRYHKKWKDYLNIKDLCVIWGKNVTSGVYKEMTFSSRDFTCHYQYPNAEVGSLFSEDCLSNNHILSGKEDLKEKIMSVRRGDQIHFKGYLVTYSHKKGSYRRGTSTTRTDRGNGACETVYITDFKILKKANPTMHFLFSSSKYLILGLVIFLLVDLHFSQPSRGDKE
jgi:hypothetical protein